MQRSSNQPKKEEDLADRYKQFCRDLTCTLNSKALGYLTAEELAADFK